MANQIPATIVQFWDGSASFTPIDVQGAPPASLAVDGISLSSSAKNAFMPFDLNGFPETATFIRFGIKGTIAKTGGRDLSAAITGNITGRSIGGFLVFIDSQMPEGTTLPFDLTSDMGVTLAQLRQLGYVDSGNTFGISAGAFPVINSGQTWSDQVVLSIESAYLETDYYPEPPVENCFWERNILTTEDCSDDGGGPDPVYALVVTVTEGAASVSPSDFMPLPPGFVAETDFSLIYPGRADIDAQWTGDVWTLSTVPEAGEWTIRQGTNDWNGTLTLVDTGGGGGGGPYSVYVNRGTNKITRALNDIDPLPPGFVWGVAISISVDGETYSASWDPADEGEGAYTMLDGYEPVAIGSGASAAMTYGAYAANVILQSY